MRLPLSFLAALCLAGLSPVAAVAQNAPLTCSDFARNPDGSWSPVKPVNVNGVIMGPGVRFTPGVQFGGIDLAAVLNQQCP
jgi:hypothetical protein